MFSNNDYSNPPSGGGGSMGGGDPLSTVIAVGAQIANEAANRSTARKENKKSRDFAKSESELAYQRDQEMWNMQNAYNSPREQMKRLQDAGLNPNLVYGAQAPGNQSGSAPTYTAAEGKYGLPRFNLPDMLSMYQNFQMRDAQIQAVKAGTVNTEAVTDNVNARTARENYGLGFSKQIDPYNLDVQRNRAESSKLDVQRVLQTIRNMSQQEKGMAMDELIKKGVLKQQDLDYEIRQEERMSRESINQLRKYGATENDPLLLRMLIRMMENSGINLGF